MKFKTYSINKYLKGLKSTYKDIENITIDRFDLFQELAYVDLKELIYLSSLKELTLCNIYISNEDTQTFNKLNLRKLTLINCEVSENLIEVLSNSNLESLILDNTLINLYNLNKNLKELTIINMPYTALNVKINTLDISRAFISKEELDFSNVEKLVISSKQYQENISYFKSSSIKNNIIIKNDVRNDLGSVL